MVDNDDDDDNDYERWGFCPAFGWKKVRGYRELVNYEHDYRDCPIGETAPMAEKDSP
ncbi:MAG: hypothetical protein ACQETH_13020 [Candidatus Rifleibacteriota bacterium]